MTDQSLRGRSMVVTGAGGFLGSHLTRTLLGRGAQVRALIRYASTADQGWLTDLKDDRLEILKGDVRDQEGLTDLLDGADIVFHLASLISVPHSFENPGAHVATNAVGTYNVLSGCRVSRPSRLVYVSSSEVYGSAQYEPIDEAHPLVAQSPYAASKIAAEKLCESFALSYDLPITVVRPFNLYGPLQSNRAVIPTIIAQALRSNVIEIGDTSTRRDFNYVGDTADRLVRLAECPAANGRVVNIGTGETRSIQQVIDTVGELLGIPLETRRAASRLRPPRSEVTLLRAGTTLLEKLLGPVERTPFTTGLGHVIEDLRRRMLSAGYAI